ncbi:MAG: hypothetical protein JXB49_24975 [Bacteroidales bacterium]|nr:hypothetical protein [Bacteroidales bacterium]
MKILKTQFRLNGLPYTLFKRNEVVALYGIGGTYTDKILHWEVSKIYIRKDKYGEREHIAKNDDFGRDRSRCFNSKDQAEDYFDELTSELRMERILSQGVVKYAAGVPEDLLVIPEVSSVQSLYP